MTVIEPISTIPQLEWADKSLVEFVSAAQHTPLWSPEMWLVRSDIPLFVCGVYWPTLLVTPELWVLLTRRWIERPIATTRLAVRLLPKLLERYPHVAAQAHVDDKPSRRLIEIIGFSFVEERAGCAFYEARA